MEIENLLLITDTFEIKKSTSRRQEVNFLKIDKDQEETSPGQEEVKRSKTSQETTAEHSEILFQKERRDLGRLRFVYFADLI